MKRTAQLIVNAAAVLALIGGFLYFLAALMLP
jgi:hypothetical protein